MQSRSGKKATTEVTLLLSGGIDSAACVAFYLEQHREVHGLFVDYGQVAARKELRASRTIAEHYSIQHSRVKLSGVKEKGEGLIVGRNALLLVAALLEASSNTTIIALGVHSGTTYSDCTPSFIKKMQSLFDLYTGGVVQIGVPFIKWQKGDIWSYARSHGVPLKLTYSCERGLRQPCGRCLSCRDLGEINAR